LECQEHEQGTTFFLSTKRRRSHIRYI